MSNADNARRLAFPARISRFMAKEGHTVTDLSRLWGVSRVTISRYLSRPPAKSSRQYNAIAKFLTLWEYENLYTEESDWCSILEAIQRTKSLSVHIAYAGSLATSLAYFLFYSLQNGDLSFPFHIDADVSKTAKFSITQIFASGSFAKLIIDAPFMCPPVYSFKTGSSQVAGYRGVELMGHLTKTSVQDMRRAVINDILKQEL